jgi:hypothetical protein
MVSIRQSTRDLYFLPADIVMGTVVAWPAAKDLCMVVCTIKQGISGVKLSKKKVMM